MNIGRHSYIVGEVNIRFPEMGNLTIGNFCSIAEGLTVFLGGEHNTNNISTFPFDTRLGWPVANYTHITKGDVVIGHDVWIGKNVTILSGVIIGNGCVIGANSVVASDLFDYRIYAGNPCKLIKPKFVGCEINYLDEMEWWNWKDEQIKEASKLLTSNDVQALYDYWRMYVKA